MRTFLKSFVFAARGIRAFFRTERNGQIQGAVALVAIAAGLYFGISRAEWIVLLACIAAVISLEMLNSALETLCNLYSTDYHPLIGRIKDGAAGAVLWTSAGAAIIGILLFWPHVRALFH
ncbi:diacylglycerol kinase family protein [Flaviaesturariibacter amylovorans]|uniref:Diacylglycerol kinase family protein n=1 Tax=Flaviaesturariibacter amylovorans TaxID=1084520 RepID=A0ABP8GB14_9BACT